ncbi:hypothetical protein CHS0354_008990 [Potamilus streckersoni]|uniref:Uncharacterized protein n=1 Tax=Potamilus streckersoni TaxID=2493646 RepID=A0AAE0THM4_9BIVA|nr:hypothetical protein CHS0354_008990 [Potamilus streckersoni]
MRVQDIHIYSAGARGYIVYNMSPCPVFWGFLLVVLNGKGAISNSSELRKLDAKLSLLSSKLETIQLEVRLLKEDFQEEVQELREKLKQERQNKDNVKECSNRSIECDFKMAGISPGEVCSCNDVAKLRNALSHIGEKDMNISQAIKALENIDKQKEQIAQVGDTLFTSRKIEAAIRGFGKEKLARRKLETEMNLKILNTDSKFSNISDECRSHQPKFNEIMIAQQRMDQSLRSLTVQVDGIQSSLITLRNGRDKLFITSDQLNGSLNDLSLEMNDMKSSLNVLQDAQNELSSKSDEMSRLLAEISSETTNNDEMPRKDEEIIFRFPDRRGWDRHSKANNRRGSYKGRRNFKSHVPD